MVAISNVPSELATVVSLGEAAHGWEVDLARGVGEVIPRFEAEVGPLDILVNNAGIGYHTTLLEADLERFRHLFEVNFFAAVALSQAALRVMAPRGRGHILNVTSAGARRALGRMTAYGASKAALHGFTQSLRMEAAACGVVVSEVLPISVRTPFFAAAGYQPKGKVQTPEDVAACVVRCLEREILELCTDRATGWSFVLDALAPNLVARVLSWWEARSGKRPAPARGAAHGS